MSIVNIAIGKERALVGSDTACRYTTSDGGAHGEMSKLLVLQGMGVVMAYRGQRNMFHEIISRSLFHQEPDSFDSLIEQMPHLFHEASASQPYGQSVDMTLELYVVGWSHKREKMTGAVFVANEDGVLTESHVDTWTHSNAPEIPEDPSPLLDTHQAMFSYAQLQTTSYRKQSEYAAIGGRFFIADVTRDQILVSYVGNLG